MRILAVLLAIGCTFTPLKPLVPMGCRDIVPECLCDADGNCQWVWHCVPL